jgi:hypothetical protein
LLLGERLKMLSDHPSIHPLPTIVAEIANKTSEDILAELPTDKGELLETIGRSEIVYADPEVEYQDDEQVISWHEIWYSAVDGEQLGERMLTWNYYDTGEVGQIEIIEFDIDGNQVVDDIIQHYIDGRQPIRYPNFVQPSPVQIEPSEIFKQQIK